LQVGYYALDAGNLAGEGNQQLAIEFVPNRAVERDNVVLNVEMDAVDFGKLQVALERIEETPSKRKVPRSLAQVTRPGSAYLLAKVLEAASYHSGRGRRSRKYRIYYNIRTRKPIHWVPKIGHKLTHPSS